jgi:pyridoxal phosphate enzyme (YggS family)
MKDIEASLSALRDRIREAELAAGRPAGSVGLIAVSKTQPAEAIAEAYRLGQRDFGENYLQEALSKQEPLSEPDLVWHFIGPIQSNKTKPLAQHFHWVHSVDRGKIAERLSEQRPAALPPLNVLIQVNVSGEASKSGVEPDQAGELAAAIAELPRLKLRGLMAIPEPTDDVQSQRRSFRTLRQTLERLNLAGVDQLSMGMSHDLEAAILEGATLVRVGTAVFGPRQTSR